MNPTEPDDNDPQLKGLLRDAHPAPDLPPRFQEGVWNRLRRDSRPAVTAPGWLELLALGLRRPAYATVGLALVMFSGVWLGVRDGGDIARRTEQARYVASVSPFHRVAP